MTAPLDEKGMAAARLAYKNADYPGKSLSDAIRAYLSAVALPDELEGLLLNLEDEASFFDRAYAPDCATSKTLRGAATALSQAHSTIAALRADTNRMRAELDHVSAAIGSVRWMDPPDGGDVSLGEQVNRMRADLETAEAEVKRITEALNEIRELNMSGADENGHRWANSDLIEQTVVFALSGSKE